MGGPAEAPGWLTWLADATPKEVDLRDGTAALAAIERAESALRIVEPVSGRRGLLGVLAERVVVLHEDKVVSSRFCDGKLV